MSHTESCSCFDCIAARAAQVTRDLYRGRAVRGHCADCRAKIFVGEEYASIMTGNVVRGRIGEPSDRITGVARGPTIYRCGGCLRTEGPLTR